MSRLFIIVTGIALLLGLALQPGQAAQAPAGSFLKWTVSSGSDLSQQVTQSPEVGRRYARFYGTTAAQVADRFEGLRYGRLQKDMRTRVHFIGRNNRVVSEMRTIKKGTPVFMTAEGTPVLDAKCGNPLSTVLPMRVAKAQPAAKPAAAPVSVTTLPEPQGSEASEPTVMAGPLPATEPEPTVTAVLPQPPEILAPETLVPTAEAPAVPATESIAAAAGGGFGFLPVLGLIPLVALAADNGGGGGGPVVPEPASVIALAGGLAGFGLMCRRRS